MDDTIDYYLAIGFGSSIILCLLCIIGSVVREYYEDLHSSEDFLLNDEEIV